jgi:hypothetical protein
VHDIFSICSFSSFRVALLGILCMRKRVLHGGCIIKIAYQLVARNRHVASSCDRL